MSSVYEIVEKARKTGKIEKGTNEVTKAVERGIAKLVVYAEDVSPKEIVQHLPVLCKEKGIPCIAVDSKQKLGTAAGILVATASIVVVDSGEAAGKIAELAKPSKEETQTAVEVQAESEEEAEEKPKRTRKKKEE
ncbi:MAG: ribosomal L7Ae/L30e/S12e/Gadd45 family protein [archaeon]